MVKNGENNLSTDPATDSTRPRLIFVPSENYCGLMTYVQSFILEDLRKHCPSFSYKDNCHTLKERVESLCKDFKDPVSVSFDGSAFDSN